MLRKMMLMSSTPLLIGAEEFVIVPRTINTIVQKGYGYVWEVLSNSHIGSISPQSYQGHEILFLTCGYPGLLEDGTSLAFGDTRKHYQLIYAQRLDNLAIYKLDLTQMGNYDAYSYTSSKNIFLPEDEGKEIHVLIRGE